MPYCRIEHRRVTVNDKVYLETPRQRATLDFLSDVYEKSGIDYRRFYKMDTLSKLAFLTSELLFATVEHFDREQPKEDLGIVFFNSSASLSADLKYYETIRDREQYFPSPSDFVYTLPNIALGEIAIRNHIHGETAFYVVPRFPREAIREIVDDLIAAGMKSVLIGWAEVDPFADRIDCYMTLYTEKD